MTFVCEPRLKVHRITNTMNLKNECGVSWALLLRESKDLLCVGRGSVFLHNLTFLCTNIGHAQQTKIREKQKYGCSVRTQVPILSREYEDDDYEWRRSRRRRRENL
mmetsp:Transcript_11321/g.42444  ORF Transcript_11321/g.42444 Transcript_11321/m.42444 type:complete len:106 (+) Transcript_11321:1892-2209(+)